MENKNLSPFTITINLPQADIDVINQEGQINGFKYPTALRWVMAHWAFLRANSGSSTVGMVRESYNLWRPITNGMLSELQKINSKIKLADKFYPKENADGTNTLDWLGKLLGFEMPPKAKREKGAKVEVVEEEVITFE